MKNFLRPLLLNALLLAAPALRAESDAGAIPPVGTDNEFAAYVRRIDAAISSLKVEQFFALFEDGPGFTYVFNARPYSYAEIRELHVQSWAKLSRAVVHSNLVAVARPAPNLATVTSVGRFEFTAKDGAKRSATFALTLSLIKHPDGWRALQVHESTLPDAPPPPPKPAPAPPPVVKK